MSLKAFIVREKLLMITPNNHQKITQLNSGDYSSSMINLDTGHP